MRIPASLGLLGVLLTSQAAGETPTFPDIVRAGLETYKAKGSEAALAVWLKDSPVEGQATTATDPMQQVEAVFGNVVGYDVLTKPDVILPPNILAP